MHELDEDHIHLDGEESAPVYVGDRVVLLSVGVDIGTSTSHLIFSQLTLERQGRRLSSQYVVTDREILHRSPVVFTSYTASGLIDASALGAFIDRAYAEAGFRRDQIDAGALITTGEAALRENARAVGDLFAREGGRFVAATAGPNLESLLAAHGSGAVELSRARDISLLNIDIGGGTTKFAVCTQGRVQETAAIHLGARLIGWDSSDSRGPASGALTRVEAAGQRHARDAGLSALPRPGARLGPEDLDRLASHMADVVLTIVIGERENDYWITEPLRTPLPFRRVMFSGGVAEYVYGREDREFGDLGPRLAEALRRGASDLGLELLEPVEAISATCIGASQYTVQLSGDTIFLSDVDLLPLRGVPVVSLPEVGVSAEATAEAIRRGMVRLDLDGSTDRDGRFAVAVKWRHGADYASLRELCSGIVSALPETRNRRPLLVVVDADIAGLIGALLRQEFGVTGPIVCIDQVLLREFDYIDIGRPLPEQGVVPVVIKSLIFH